MKGYNDKMAILATNIMDKLKAIVVDPQRLEIVKEKVCPHNAYKRFKIGLKKIRYRLEWIGKTFSSDSHTHFPTTLHHIQ